MNTILFTQRFFAMFFYEILILLMFLISISVFFGGGGASNKAKNIVASFLGLTMFIALWYASSYNPEATGTTVMSIIDLLYTYVVETGVLIFIVIIGAFFILYGWLTSERRPTQVKSKIAKAFEELGKALEDINKK